MKGNRGGKGGRQARGGRAAAKSPPPGSAGDGGAALRPLQPLPAADLHWRCPPVKASGKAPTAAFLLGQERPMAAMRTGLSIQAPGYHLFVSGLIGSGRATVVENLLRDIQPICRRTPDRVLACNFREPHRPVLLSLPPGKGVAFRDELHELGRGLHASLQAALRSRPHRMSRRVVLGEGEARERRIMEALQRQAQKQGCALVRFQAQNGASTADIYPVVEGEPITLDALSTLAIEGKIGDAQRTALLAAREQLLDRLEEVSDRVRGERSRMQGELREMDRKLAYKVLQAQTAEFRRRWPQPDVADWLDLANEYVERRLHQFLQQDEQRDEAGSPGAAAGDGGEVPRLVPPEQRFLEFAAQVVKTSHSDACPVVSETNPTFANLFGTIEPPREGLPPGPCQVHPGALLRAEGGFLILRCVDILRETGVWPYLKRVLQSQRLEIREFDPASGGTGGTLLPAAIPIDLKVVLIGEPGVYEQLAAEDPQFPQIFKIHAEFDATIPAVKENLVRYADYLGWVTDKDRLPGFTAEGVAAVAEYGARAAGRRDRLITRYSELGDLAREAAHLCVAAGDRAITRAHVLAAVRARHWRHDLSQELTERDYASGYMRLSTSGMAVGQVNALTVLDTGSLEFGRPCRITCNCGMAVPQRAGLINIEGAVNLSGPIHDKGVLILEGFLLQEFGNHGPLCMQATICFEQLYNGVEGDSASLAQLLALLSALGEVPIDQGLAVTGSINQKGEVQAVAAVNEKIEGFYRLCRARRLTGRQGVVLPRANVGDLMLEASVVEAVERGEFTVHAVARVEEAIELFAHAPAREVLAGVAGKLAHFRRMAGLGG